MNQEEVTAHEVQTDHEVEVLEDDTQTLNVSKKTWCFTLNNWTEEEYEAIVAITGYTYLIIGKEGRVPPATPHLQGCITFRKSQRFNRVKVLLGDRCHIEYARNTSQSRTYCKKEGDFQEWDNREQGKRSDLDEAIETLKNDGIKKMKDEHANVFVKYPNGINALAAHYMKPRDPNNPPRVMVWYGNTGTGKTKRVHELWRPEQIYVCNANMSWWDGYTQQPVLLIDDFRSHQYMFSNLLRLLDRYPYQVEVKGAHVQINSPTIVITADLHPENWYSSAVGDVEQLLRRCTDIVEFIKCEPFEFEIKKGHMVFAEPESNVVIDLTNQTYLDTESVESTQELPDTHN